MSDPTGVTVEDRETGQLRHETEWTVLDKGRFRVLRLRVGRGVIRDERESEEE